MTVDFGAIRFALSLIIYYIWYWRWWPNYADSGNVITSGIDGHFDRKDAPILTIGIGMSRESGSGTIGNDGEGSKECPRTSIWGWFWGIKIASFVGWWLPIDPPTKSLPATNTVLLSWFSASSGTTTWFLGMNGCGGLSILSLSS